MIGARAEVIGPKACESAEASRTRRVDRRRTPDSLSPAPPPQRSRPRDSEGVPSAGAGYNVISDDELIALTSELAGHPDGWDHPCMCGDCRSEW